MRKHRTALAALAVWHFVFFFPTLFMHRVVSPNDVFSNFDPWATVRPLDVQNSVINDPPTSYFTLMSLLKSRPSAFHWNPFIASGVPGFGSSASAVLSPFIAIPTLLLPLTWVYSGIIFLKLNVAFHFAYLWLREERLGKRGAAIGAIIFAASGALAVRWLWQVTNATTLYPALFWIVCRLARGRRVPVWSAGLIFIAYALSGFPATMAYGVYVASAYFVFLIVRRSAPLQPGVGRGVRNASFAALLALLITAPSLVPFVQFVKRTGYLGVRANLSMQLFFPLRHLASFIRPLRLGSHADHNWVGDRALGVLNNDVEATVYAGLAALPLIAIALFNRRARTKWFWLAVVVVCLCGMFGFFPLARLLALLPGIKYSWLTRLQVVVPAGVAYLAAAGAQKISRHTFVAIAIAALAAADLGVFAGRFHPYLEPSVAEIPSTPMIDFLRAEQRPFRIAPFFIYLWPNVSEYVRVEDVRSHFSSEAAYRRMLARVDPTSWGTASTILSFNSLKFDFDDPFVSMLGVRYYLEHKNIDIIKWKTFEKTVPGTNEKGIAPLVLESGRAAQREIGIDAEPFYAIEVPATVEETFAPHAHVTLTLIKGTQVMHRRDWSADDVRVMNKMYVPLHAYARLGERVIVRVQANGLRLSLPTAGASFFYGRVTTPVIFERELPDGRVFRNAAEVPRFVCASEVRKMNEEQFLAAKEIDFSRTAVITDASAPIPSASDATAAIKTYGDARQDVVVVAPAATFLASSEKLTPELRVTIDDRDVKPVTINLLFAGVPVPAGTHTITFTRRLARGWWPLSGAALLMLIAISVIDAHVTPASGRPARRPPVAVKSAD